MTPTSLDPISDELELVEKEMLEPDPGRCGPVTGAIARLVGSGGKRVRPRVTLLVCRLLGADCQRVISLAAAVETLHTATLVHDDIIDGALVRRGEPTLNASWSPGAAILTGDYLFARAADFAARTGTMVVMRLFAQTLMTICNGELHQLLADRRQLIDRSQYLRRIYAKTGALFVLAAKASGVMAAASDEVLGHLHTYGRELGIAFQIVDDLLDLVGSESQVGKPLGSDLAHGLVTLPVICFLEQHPGDDRILTALSGASKAEHVPVALEAIRNSEAIKQTRDEALRHVTRAREAMLNLPDNRFRQALLDLADHSVQRQL